MPSLSGRRSLAVAVLFKLQSYCGFFEFEPGIAREEFGWVAIAQIAEEILPLGKNSAFTLPASKPDMGPQSSPKERAARMKYPACRELLRKAV